METIQSAETIQNKVAESGIRVLDLEQFIPRDPVSGIDVASFLDGGYLLREKAYRSQLKALDWSEYEGHHVGIFCSTDAIVPPWAFMLVASFLKDVALTVSFGTEIQVMEALTVAALDRTDWQSYTDQIVVLKGCGSSQITPAAYTRATTALQRVARKLMYGEPCSSVPIWRRPTA